MAIQPVSSPVSAEQHAGIDHELYRRTQHDPDDGSYIWGRDYGRDILRDLNKMAHTHGVGALTRDLLQRAYSEIVRLRDGTK